MLLAVTAAVILVAAAVLFVDALRAGTLVDASVEILDALLLVLMIVGSIVLLRRLTPTAGVEAL